VAAGFIADPDRRFNVSMLEAFQRELIALDRTLRSDI
jgi:hypothetical protein